MLAYYIMFGTVLVPTTVGVAYSTIFLFMAWLLWEAPVSIEFRVDKWVCTWVPLFELHP